MFFKMNAKVISVYNDLFAVKMYHTFFTQYLSVSAADAPTEILI
jgi:hypothetical protein